MTRRCRQVVLSAHAAVYFEIREAIFSSQLPAPQPLSLHSFSSRWAACSIPPRLYQLQKLCVPNLRVKMGLQIRQNLTYAVTRILQVLIGESSKPLLYLDKIAVSASEV